MPPDSEEMALVSKKTLLTHEHIHHEYRISRVGLIRWAHFRSRNPLRLDMVATLHELKHSSNPAYQALYEPALLFSKTLLSGGMHSSAEIEVFVRKVGKILGTEFGTFYVISERNSTLRCVIPEELAAGRWIIYPTWRAKR